MKTVVELEGVNGDIVHLAGPRAGEEGMFMAPGFKGYLDPPFKVFWDEQMDTHGEIYTGSRYESRELTLVVYVLGDEGAGNWWETRDKRYRRLFRPDREAKLHISTTDGMRTLRIRPVANHKISTKTDPRGQSLNEVTTHVKAGDPFWYAPDYVDVQTPGAGDHSLTFTVENRTDQVVWPVWVVPEKSTTTLPDYKFENGQVVDDRHVVLPELFEGESTVVQTNPGKRPLTSANGAPVLARWNGRRMLNHLPPYLPPTDVTVSIKGSQVDSEIMLRIPKPYTMPWGE